MISRRLTNLSAYAKEQDAQGSDIEDKNRSHTTVLYEPGVQRHEDEERALWRRRKSV